MRFKLLNESALAKKYPDAARADILLPDEKTLFLPSRSIALNWQLGGGLPFGRIAELFGYESTGKSLLAMDFGYVAQQLGGIMLWGDAEGTFTPAWARKNGLDPAKVFVYDANDIEGYSDWHFDMILHWRSKLTKNQPILLVCDSIAALDCKDNINSSQMEAKAEMGNRAKAIYKMYRLRSHFYKTMGVTVLMINQVRKKVGASMFEAAETTPGGDSTKFYATQRIGLVPSKQIKGVILKSGKFKEETGGNGKKIGRNVIIQIAKNKIAPPRDSVKTQVYFHPDIWNHVGYSRYHGLPEILVAEGVLTKKGAYYYYKTHTVAQGEDALIQLLYTDEHKRKILLNAAPINTLSKTRKKLEAIKSNLYPVKGKAEETEEEEDEK